MDPTAWAKSGRGRLPITTCWPSPKPTALGRRTKWHGWHPPPRTPFPGPHTQQRRRRRRRVGKQWLPKWASVFARRRPVGGATRAHSPALPPGPRHHTAPPARTRSRYLRLLVFAMAELDLLDPAAPGEGANAEHRFRGGTDADLLDVMRARRVLEKAAQAHGSAESWEDGNLRARNWLAARLAKFSEQLPDPSAQDSTAGSQVGERFSDADLQAFRRGDARVVHDVRAREFIVVRCRGCPSVTLASQAASQLASPHAASQGMGLLAAPEAYVTRGGAYFYVGALQVGLMGSTPNVSPHAGGRGRVRGRGTAASPDPRRRRSHAAGEKLAPSPRTCTWATSWPHW